jgi:hypothetical protein
MAARSSRVTQARLVSRLVVHDVSFSLLNFCGIVIGLEMVLWGPSWGSSTTPPSRVDLRRTTTNRHIQQLSSTTDAQTILPHRSISHTRQPSNTGHLTLRDLIVNKSGTCLHTTKFSQPPTILEDHILNSQFLLVRALLCTASANDSVP